MLADAEPAVAVTGAGEPDLAELVPAGVRRVVAADAYDAWVDAQHPRPIPASRPGRRTPR